MRKILLSSVSVAALTLVTITSAQAQSTVNVMAGGPWYVSLFGGASYAHPAKSRVFSASITSLEQSFKSGFSVGLTAGKQLTDVLRAEVELSYSRFANDKLTLIAPSGSR